MSEKMSGKIMVVTGPARSGKSEWAEQLAAQSEKAVIYVATAQDDPNDLEWLARIRQHQARRPSSWQTKHCPKDLVSVLSEAQASHCLLVDSLGTWVANHLALSESAWKVLSLETEESLSRSLAQVIFVAEETGWGVVPAYPLGRTFRDRLGTLTRRMTSMSDEAYLVCAGVAINLKQIGQIVQGPKFER
jgi:adenosylcobinamide kinase/adenosylcobinamide-phosphate guanylyltransferase